MGVGLCHSWEVNVKGSGIDCWRRFVSQVLNIWFPGKARKKIAKQAAFVCLVFPCNQNNTIPVRA